MTQDLIIDRVGAHGDGVAETPDGPVYAPLTLPGEVVRGEIHDRRLELMSVVRPSPDRVAPASPHYGECGGCSLQHWASGPYLEWKQELVRLALAREGLETVLDATVPTPPGSRRRLALHARRGEGGRAVLGFKARRSWRLVEVIVCPIADPRLTAALPSLAEIAQPFLEHPASAPTLHVTWTQAGIDIDVTGVERRSGGLSRDSQMRAIQAASAADVARLSLAGEVLMMARQPTVEFGPATVPLPPGAFLQASPPAEQAMVDRVLAAVKGARRIADLFCGAGTFTFPLATIAPVLAADGAAPATSALKAGMRSARRIKPIDVQTRDLFRRPLAPYDLRGCDAVVLDPPRAGAVEQVAQLGGSKAEVVAYVSCNPTTFARDARVLAGAGFRLERATPIDQFLWSAHVELVGIFRR